MPIPDLNSISTAVVAIATVALAIFTWRYVRLTRHLLDQTRKANNPNVIVGLEFGEFGSELSFKITNMGQMPAINIRVEVINDQIPWAGKNDGFNKLAPIQKGIAYLPPGQQLSYHVGFIDWKKSENEICKAELQIVFESERGDKLSRTIYFDLGQYERMLLNKQPGSNIVRVLERIERSLKPDPVRSFMFQRHCKHCRGEIKRGATICPHCRKPLTIRAKMDRLRQFK